MGDLAVPPASRVSLAALSRLDAKIGATQNRIATGKRVNRPTDNPAAFFTASALSARLTTARKAAFSGRSLAYHPRCLRAMRTPACSP
jgi:flagellin-like hook-associated protein FlgL